MNYAQAFADRSFDTTEDMEERFSSVERQAFGLIMSDEVTPFDEMDAISVMYDTPSDGHLTDTQRHSLQNL